MKSIRYLALVPPLGTLLGPLLHNDVQPFILGMPFILGWISVWLFLTTPVMALIYWLDPANRKPEQGGGAS